MAKEVETEKTISEPAAEKPMPTDAELLELYSTADADTKKAFVALLKGGNPQPQDLMAMLADVIGSENVGDLIKNIGNMLTSIRLNKKPGALQKAKKPGVGSLLTFTYLYSLSIYVMLLSFYFWQIRTDIKPEK